MPQAEKKIATSITVSDKAQVIALAVTLISRISQYEREQVLRTIASFFGFTIAKL